jgi:hypothetical protein
MSALSLLSIALLLASLAGCAVLWTRSGETRVGLFGVLFLLIAIHQAVAPWTFWSELFVWDVSSIGSLAGLAVGVLGIFTVIALWRTLAERDRAERLHWDSMETVRVINELNERDSIPLDTKFDKLLAMGIARFDLEVAMIARIRKDRYEITSIQSPESFPVASGAVFSLEETFCKNTLRSERPLGIEQISEATDAGLTARPAFPFNAYLGATITVDGNSYGTLSFASFEPRKERFNGTEKDLIRLMAHWLGSEIEKRDTPKTHADSPVEEPTLATPAPSSSAAQPVAVAEPTAVELKDAPTPVRKRSSPRYVERVIDPNRMLQRMGSELRALASHSVKFEMKLDPTLGFAAAQNLPFKAIARTMVMNAMDAMPEGGKLVVETTNLEIAAGEPEQVPTLAPDRYVTISFIDTGSEPDADALGRLFDRTPIDAELPSNDDRLPLSTVYRILQICGGDLSVEIEPGSGSTFTVYLPRAHEQVRTPRKPAASPEPMMPSSTAH